MASGVPDHDELARLKAEADHHRRRLELYRAKAYGMRPTSPVRMRELERQATGAADRLAAAQARAAQAGSGS
jgi:hypothetical protein